jgi:quercetin dioxygenase-like cupin family protein
MGPMLNFDLSHEIDALRREVEYERGHNARTLIKHSEFRIVLVALTAGSHLHETHTDQRIALQPLRGHIRLHLGTDVVNLHAEQLLSLDHETVFSIAAVEDSAFLLWVGWSKE